MECMKCASAACCNRSECQQKFNSLHTAQSCECSLINVAVLVMSMQQGTILAIPSDSSLSSVQQTRDINDWGTYFKYKSHDFTDNLDPRMLKLPPVMGLITDCLSVMLTIVYGIKLSIPEYESMDELTIHIVGAESSELKNLPRYEEILHMLPWIKRVHIVLVGPYEPLKEFSTKMPMPVAVGCMDCQANRNLTYDVIHGLYHQVKISSSYSKPDIVLASHAGLHEHGNLKGQNLNESWKDTAKLLSNMDVPVIYTAYTETEGNDDQAILRDDWGVNILLECTKNPFRGLSPSADEQVDNRYYYSNHYITLTRGRIMR